MKFLQNIVEKLEPQFEKGGKFEKLWPLFDGFATFAFVPKHPTSKGAHIRDGVDLKRTMITVVIAMIPCLIFGIWNTGHQHFLARLPKLLLDVGDQLRRRVQMPPAVRKADVR